ncbi:gag-pol polyprotein [Tanacetum coccineum]
MNESQLARENRRNQKEDRQFKTSGGLGGDEREVNETWLRWARTKPGGQLDDLGCKVKIQYKIMKIIKGALILMRGEKVAANLYQLKGDIIEEAEALVVLHSLSHKVAVTWHQKLRYMSEQGMKILMDMKLIPDLTKVSLPFCEHYVISKQHRLKFKTSNSKSVSVLELVHSDM